MSLKLQRQLSKEQILEGYLNTIYFGRGAYGIQAASLAFFDKPAKDLTLREAAVLASVINNPSQFDPANGKDNKEALRERYEYVLAGMAAMGTADPDAAAKAAKRLPKFPEIDAESQYGGQRGHMLKLVRDELVKLGYTEQEIDGGGLRVTTTFTEKDMAAAEQGVLEERPEGFDGGKLHVAVATVEPGTGALRGFYAGQDYLDSQINWAVAGGMVGSTFKPITLTTAITEGFSLEDTFEGNSPYVFPDGLEVRNEGGGDGNDYGSAVDATYALEQSINTAFVDMSNSIPDGPDKIYQTALEMGVPPNRPARKYPGIPAISRDLEPDALITLGKARISPINMANTYATIANEGQRADVHVIEKVVDSNGETDYTLQGGDHRRGRRGRRLRRVLRDAAGRRAGHRSGGPGARPAGGRQDRHRDQRQGRGVLGLVRGLHPADVDGGDVRPRRRRRPARRLAAVVLRCRLPRPRPGPT